MSSYIEDLFSLSGRVALVTGASNGIGQRMSETLARAGARVVVLARRKRELEVTADRIRMGGGHAAVIVADLLQLSEMDNLHERVAAAFGPPDILVNAAGVNLRLPPGGYTPEQWNQTLMLNLSVPYFLACACVPVMIAQGSGNIINIASLQSFRAFANGIAYGASKGGVAQLTRAMAEAWSQHGVVANAIQPGFFPTELTAPVFSNPEIAAHHARMTAAGRNGAMRDLDGATVFLSSRAAAFVTGQIIGVDGGYMAK
jgi:NAD(P)-dependent dehydrogenase (short-subunit alcohol dehydrogenase family)